MTKFEEQLFERIRQQTLLDINKRTSDAISALGGPNKCCISGGLYTYLDRQGCPKISLVDPGVEGRQVTESSLFNFICQAITVQSERTTAKIAELKVLKIADILSQVDVEKLIKELS